MCEHLHNLQKSPRVNPGRFFWFVLWLSLSVQAAAGLDHCLLFSVPVSLSNSSRRRVELIIAAYSLNSSVTDKCLSRSVTPYIPLDVTKQTVMERPEASFSVEDAA